MHVPLGGSEQFSCHSSHFLTASLGHPSSLNLLKSQPAGPTPQLVLLSVSLQTPSSPSYRRDWGLLTLMALHTSPWASIQACPFPKPSQAALGGNVVSDSQHYHADCCSRLRAGGFACSAVSKALIARANTALMVMVFLQHPSSLPKGHAGISAPHKSGKSPLDEWRDGECRSRLCKSLPPQPRCPSPCQGSLQCNTNNSLL